jgi:response regulator RpfG family c-di-GMP phosphodiesterase
MRQTEERQNSQERVQQLAAAEYEGALAETRQLILSINSVIGEPSNNTEHRLKRATQIGMEISKDLKLSTNRAARQKRFNQQIKSLMIEHGAFNI